MPTTHLLYSVQCTYVDRLRVAGLAVSKVLEGADLVKDSYWDIFSMTCNSSSPCWQIDRQMGPGEGLLLGHIQHDLQLLLTLLADRQVGQGGQVGH